MLQTRPVPLLLLGLTLSAAGCTVPTDDCTRGQLGATFTLDADAVNSYTGGSGTLSFDECATECEVEVMQNYPQEVPNLCELESDGGDGSQTYYCEWEADISCG